jgi:Mg2+-importing ATPase
VLFLVLFTLIVNVTIGRDAFRSVLFSVALAVGLTPEFLPMITTVTLAQGAIRMARRCRCPIFCSSAGSLARISPSSKR